jgi:hypothetical protein
MKLHKEKHKHKFIFIQLSPEITNKLPTKMDRNGTLAVYGRNAVDFPRSGGNHRNTNT